jgi:hypothetical protein
VDWPRDRVLFTTEAETGKSTYKFQPRRPKAVENCTNQRQATQHACLPRLLGWAVVANKVKRFAVRKILFCIGLTGAAKAGQKSDVPARQVQRTNHRRTPFESPFTSVLSFQRQHGVHHSQVSLVITLSFPSPSSNCHILQRSLISGLLNTLYRPNQSSRALQGGGGKYEHTGAKLFMPVKAKSDLRSSA